MESAIKSRLIATLDKNPVTIDETNFVSSAIITRDDVGARKSRLAQIVSTEIVPRLAALHSDAREPDIRFPTREEIVELAHLVLSPDLKAAAAYVTLLREQGLPMETLFVELLQPAAQHLGRMWDEDECDFVDVTLGVGQLQKLLAIFNCTHDLPAINEKRRVFVTLTPGEQHFFGLAMVTKLLSAAAWNVTVCTEPTIRAISEAVARDWYAVAGIASASVEQIGPMTAAVAAIRAKSRNPAIGVMVGGSCFADRPELVRQVGADGTAANATTAVLLTQKLFDIGAKADWLGTRP